MSLNDKTTTKTEGDQKDTPLFGAIGMNSLDLAGTGQIGSNALEAAILQNGVDSSKREQSAWRGLGGGIAAPMRDMAVMLDYNTWAPTAKAIGQAACDLEGTANKAAKAIVDGVTNENIEERMHFIGCSTTNLVMGGAAVYDLAKGSQVLGKNLAEFNALKATRGVNEATTGLRTASTVDLTANGLRTAGRGETLINGGRSATRIENLGRTTNPEALATKTTAHNLRSAELPTGEIPGLTPSAKTPTIKPGEFTPAHPHTNLPDIDAALVRRPGKTPGLEPGPTLGDLHTGNFQVTRVDVPATIEGRLPGRGPATELPTSHTVTIGEVKLPQGGRGTFDANPLIRREPITGRGPEVIGRDTIHVGVEPGGQRIGRLPEQGRIGQEVIGGERLVVEPGTGKTVHVPENGRLPQDKIGGETVTVDPAHPHKVVEPNRVVEPTDVVDPTHPNRVVELTDVVDPAHPNRVVDPAQPRVEVEPVKVDPMQPRVEVEPTRLDPTQPRVEVEPTRVDPAQPHVEVEPTRVDPTQPRVEVDPAKVDPTQPRVEVEPAKVDPTQPRVEVEPAKVDPAQPRVEVEPAKVDPTQPRVEVEPAKVDPAQPRVEVEPAKVDPTQPRVEVEPAKIDPTQPRVEVEPAKVDPAQPRVEVEPTKVDPAQPHVEVNPEPTRVVEPTNVVEPPKVNPETPRVVEPTNVVEPVKVNPEPTRVVEPTNVVEPPRVNPEPTRVVEPTNVVEPPRVNPEPTRVVEPTNVVEPPRVNPETPRVVEPTNVVEPPRVTPEPTPTTVVPPNTPQPAPVRVPDSGPTVPGGQELPKVPDHTPQPAIDTPQPRIDRVHPDVHVVEPVVVKPIEGPRTPIAEQNVAIQKANLPQDLQPAIERLVNAETKLGIGEAKRQLEDAAAALKVDPIAVQNMVDAARELRIARAVDAVPEGMLHSIRTWVAEHPELALAGRMTRHAVESWFLGAEIINGLSGGELRAQWKDVRDAGVSKPVAEPSTSDTRVNLVKEDSTSVVRQVNESGLQAVGDTLAKMAESTASASESSAAGVTGSTEASNRVEVNASASESQPDGAASQTAPSATPAHSSGSEPSGAGNASSLSTGFFGGLTKDDFKWLNSAQHGGLQVDHQYFQTGVIANVVADSTAGTVLINRTPMLRIDRDDQQPRTATHAFDWRLTRLDLGRREGSNVQNSGLLAGRRVDRQASNSSQNTNSNAGLSFINSQHSYLAAAMQSIKASAQPSQGAGAEKTEQLNTDANNGASAPTQPINTAAIAQAAASAQQSVPATTAVATNSDAELTLTLI